MPSSSAMTVEKFRIKESVRSIEIIRKRKPRSITYRQRKYRKDIVERHIAIMDMFALVIRDNHILHDLTADHPMPTSVENIKISLFIVVVATAQNKHHSDDL